MKHASSTLVLTLASTLILTLLATIFFSPMRSILESSMLTHFFLLYPLYIGMGFILAGYMNAEEHTSTWLKALNAGGVSGILIASFTFSFWMIPLWVDQSISDSTLSAIKAISLVFLVGFPLRLSWYVLNPIFKAFIQIEFLVMLFRVGWIYCISPIRLCNNYLIDEQKTTGEWMILLGLSLAVGWLIEAFFIDQKKTVPTTIDKTKDRTKDNTENDSTQGCKVAYQINDKTP